MSNMLRKIKRNGIREEIRRHPKLKRIKHDVDETAFSKIYHEVIKYEKSKNKEEK